jgi:hypothetical protein
MTGIAASGNCENYPVVDKHTHNEILSSKKLYMVKFSFKFLLVV